MRALSSATIQIDSIKRQGLREITNVKTKRNKNKF